MYPRRPWGGIPECRSRDRPLDRATILRNRAVGRNCSCSSLGESDLLESEELEGWEQALARRGSFSARGCTFSAGEISTWTALYIPPDLEMDGEGFVKISVPKNNVLHFKRKQTSSYIIDWLHTSFCSKTRHRQQHTASYNTIDIIRKIYYIYDNTQYRASLVYIKFSIVIIIPVLYHDYTVHHVTFKCSRNTVDEGSCKDQLHVGIV